MASRKPTPDAASSAPVPPLPSPQPALAGHPRVFVSLKQRLGMLPVDEEISTTIIGLDEFPLVDGSPLASEHELVTQLIDEIVRHKLLNSGHGFVSGDLIFNEGVTGAKISGCIPARQAGVHLASLERLEHALRFSAAPDAQSLQWRSQGTLEEVIAPLRELKNAYSREGLMDLLLISSFAEYNFLPGDEAVAQLFNQLQHDAVFQPLTPGERFVLSLFRASRIRRPLLGTTTTIIDTIGNLIQDGARFCLVPREFWTDAINMEFSRLSAGAQAALASLFQHAATASSARPSAKWLRTAAQKVGAFGEDNIKFSLVRWLPLVSGGRSGVLLPGFIGDTRPRSELMIDANATALRGLLWMIQTLPDGAALAREVTAVALSAYKKVPGIGPRAVRVGNAALYALSKMGTLEAVGKLALLKVRVRSGSAQKEVEKAFNEAASALGLPREDIEEMGVPTYGLQPGGTHSETLGGYTAQIVVTGSNAELRWQDAHGKALKSVPAKVKQDHKDELKELQQSLKDIQGMLPAQRDRIDSAFLLQKSWPVAVWRERYLDHPLVGTIARRLIWCVDGTPACFADGTPRDVSGAPIEHGQTAEITLWHPVGRSVDEVVAWRRRLEDLSITQPFKQAYREVYLLTEAELRTNTYSNRFAAHVIRQHQFHALCAARGWKNKLRLLVDADYEPPMKELPQWGLRAEFWVEGIGQDWGTDINDAGAFLRLATDQVRFYRSGAAPNAVHASGGGYAQWGRPSAENDPVPLSEIPPLVFSEIMRDVDLFVGVASLGNDPAWQDGGADGRYRDYWNNYSFGELSGSAATRKQALERLVPRLKIADRCSFSDRFLVVRGDLRTYKIHLGSGNILMEPNDQYLCIVPDSKSRKSSGDLQLPFEGDSVLSIVLSKALLLSEDRKITDVTITRQIALG